MIYSTLFIAAAAIFGLASAQNYSTSGGNLTVVPDSVSIDLRQSWCRGQTANCPMICGGQAFPNQCYVDTLTYSCVCTDGSHPNISDYDATLPSFICQQWVIDCVAAHPNDLSGQTECHQTICGSKNASAVAQTGGGGPRSSSAPSSTSASASGSQTSSGAASSATNTGAAVALQMGRSYGTSVLAVGMAAVFGLAL